MAWCRSWKVQTGESLPRKIQHQAISTSILQRRHLAPLHPQIDFGCFSLRRLAVARVEFRSEDHSQSLPTPNHDAT